MSSKYLIGWLQNQNKGCICTNREWLKVGKRSYNCLDWANRQSVWANKIDERILWRERLKNWIG